MLRTIIGVLLLTLVLPVIYADSCTNTSGSLDVCFSPNTARITNTESIMDYIHNQPVIGLEIPTKLERIGKTRIRAIRELIEGKNIALIPFNTSQRNLTLYTQEALESAKKGEGIDLSNKLSEESQELQSKIDAESDITDKLKRLEELTGAELSVTVSSTQSTTDILNDLTHPCSEKIVFTPTTALLVRSPICPSFSLRQFNTQDEIQYLNELLDQSIQEANLRRFRNQQFRLDGGIYMNYAYDITGTQTIDGNDAGVALAKHIQETDLFAGSEAQKQTSVEIIQAKEDFLDNFVEPELTLETLTQAYPQVGQKGYELLLGYYTGISNCEKLTELINANHGFRTTPHYRAQLAACIQEEREESCEVLNPSENPKLTLTFVNDQMPEDVFSQTVTTITDEIENAFGSNMQHTTIKQLTATEQLTSGGIRGNDYVMPRIYHRTLREETRYCQANKYIVLSQNEYFPFTHTGNTYASYTGCNLDAGCMAMYTLRGLGLSIFSLPAEAQTVMGMPQLRPEIEPTIRNIVSRQQKEMITQWFNTN